MRAAVLLLVSACSFDPGFGPQGVAPPDADADPDGMPAPDDTGPTKEFVLAYNINGPAVVGVDFPGMWAADPGGICNGDAWNVTFDVTNTVDDALFQYYQYRVSGGTIACNLGSSLASGMYEVTLLFGEVWAGPGCSDPTLHRVFDVLIEGTKVEDNIDTNVEGKCCDPGAPTPGRPFKRVYTVSVTDGTVNVVLDAEPMRDTFISAVMLQRIVP